MKPDLSIIIPFAGEYPQALFTIQSIASTLLGKLNFEIIAVNNMCPELTTQWQFAQYNVARDLSEKAAKQNGELMVSDINEIASKLAPSFHQDKAGDAIKASAGGNPWLRYMEYNEQLSHWECKRLACIAAKADTFLFIDAHCVPDAGIPEMYSDYINGYESIGTFHMPLTYKILEWRKLIYKMVVENNFYGYSFTSMPDKKVQLFEVSCMSTCGMMISRQVYERVGGWPTSFGAYGGGENFMNYALSVTGHSKFIHPGTVLHHHGERRDYHSTYDGTIWNRFVAHYLFGGYKALINLREVTKGRPEILNDWVTKILHDPNYIRQRLLIKDNTIITLNEWVAKWRKKE